MVEKVEKKALKNSQNKEKNPSEFLKKKYINKIQQEFEDIRNELHKKQNSKYETKEEYIYEVPKTSKFKIEKNIKQKIETNGKELKNNKFNKMNFNIITTQENKENLIEKYKYSKVDNKIKKRNVIEEVYDYYDDINKKTNYNSLSYSKRSYPTRLKLYKCVFWRYSDYDINNDILETVNRYRTRSQSSNNRKSFSQKSRNSAKEEKFPNKHLELSKKKKIVLEIIIFQIQVIKTYKSYVNIYKEN